MSSWNVSDCGYHGFSDTDRCAFGDPLVLCGSAGSSLPHRLFSGWGLLVVAVHGLLIAVASLVTAPRLQSTGSVVVALGLSCSVCGIFPDQGLNLCLLHWLADSLPLSHQEALGPTFYISKLR